MRVAQQLPFVAICPAEAPVCSSCGHTLERVHLKPGGTALIKCSRRHASRQYCAQWNLVLGLYGRLCVVVHLTDEQETAARELDGDARAVLEELRLLVFAYTAARAATASANDGT